MSGERDRAILEAVADHRVRSVAEIMVEVTYHPIEVDRICRRLHQEEHIRRVHGGVYQLTPAGEQYLATIRSNCDSES